MIQVKIARHNAAGAATAKFSVTVSDRNGPAKVSPRSLSESQSHSHQANLLVQILLPRLQTPLQTDLNHKLPALPRKLPQGVLANCQTRLDLDVLKNTLELAIRSEDMCKFLFIKFWTWARHSVARPRSSPSARQKEFPGAKSLDRDLDVRTWPHAHYLVR